jgi:predicted deacylase
VSRGVSCFSCEVGEFYGFQLKEGDRPAAQPLRTVPEVGVTALTNIMKYMDMLEGKPKLPTRQLVVFPENNLRPSHGGAFYSEFRANAIGKVVPKGTLLGRVVSPYTFEVLGEIRAPYDQNMIIGLTDKHPFARINAGDYGFLVTDMANAEWVTNNARGEEQ